MLVPVAVSEVLPSVAVALPVAVIVSVGTPDEDVVSVLLPGPPVDDPP